MFVEFRAMNFVALLAASAADFRANLSNDDTEQIALARNIFLVSIMASVSTYYLLVPNARFPATVSYIGRKGAPFWVGASIWLVGPTASDSCRGYAARIGAPLDI